MEGRYVLPWLGRNERRTDRCSSSLSPYDLIVEVELDATGSVTLPKHP